MSRVRLLHPVTGSTTFGVLPVLRLGPRFETPECPIFLYEGKHNGPHKGYGAKHIWAEHQKEIFQCIGMPDCPDAMHLVALYVARLLQPQTPVYYEGGVHKRPRVHAVRINTGTCILQFESGNAPHWHVVTAFNRRQGHGKRVGQTK